METSAPGVEVTHRCRFMGLRAIENGVLRFYYVRSSATDRIGEEGQGLRIALSTLNIGRLGLPAAVVGAAKTSPARPARARPPWRRRGKARARSGSAVTSR